MTEVPADRHVAFPEDTTEFTISYDSYYATDLGYVYTYYLGVKNIAGYVASGEVSDLSKRKAFEEIQKAARVAARRWVLDSAAPSSYTEKITLDSTGAVL